MKKTIGVDVSIDLYFTFDDDDHADVMEQIEDMLAELQYVAYVDVTDVTPYYEEVDDDGEAQPRDTD